MINDKFLVVADGNKASRCGLASMTSLPEIRILAGRVPWRFVSWQKVCRAYIFSQSSMVPVRAGRNINRRHVAFSCHTPRTAHESNAGSIPIHSIEKRI